MNATILFWCALGATGLCFAIFAFLVILTINAQTTVYAQRVGEETSRDLEDVFLFISPAKIAQLGLYGAIASFFVFFIPFLDLANVVSTLVGVALGGLAAVLAFSIPRRCVAILRVRRRIKFEEQLVDALGSMSNALRAGFSVHQAFEGVVKAGLNPIAQEFSVCLQQIRLGMGFDEALSSLAHRVASDDLTLVVSAIDVARKTGGNLTEIFDSLAQVIRARMRIERRVRTLTAQGRMQGIVVSLMPLALGIILTFMKPALMIPFLTSVTGLCCVGFACLLVFVGWLVIRRIIHIDV